MAFKKIKETIAAFKHKPRKVTIEEMVVAYGKELHQRCSGQDKVRETMRLGVYVAVVIPSAYLISHMLSQLTGFKSETLGAIALIIGVLVGWLGATIHQHLIGNIPLDKLNPFFGSKLEETFESFKHPTKNQA